MSHLTDSTRPRGKKGERFVSLLKTKLRSANLCEEKALY